MVLATLSSDSQLSGDRAIELARLAVDKAPNDARLHANAYWICFQLGRDEAANPDWLAQAAEYSTPDEGPIWSVNLDTLANEWIPKRQQYLQDVTDELFAGKIPIAAAARMFGTSLVRLFIQVPAQNAETSDARRQVPVPTVASNRVAVDIDPDSIVGFDITTVLSLEYLGLLETTLDIVSHAKFSPDVLWWLFQEQRECRFHQPSRIRNAEQLCRLVHRGRLGVIKPEAPASDSSSHGADVSFERLLGLARGDGGIVVSVFPLYKRGSLMSEEVNLGDDQCRVISTVDFCDVLKRNGMIEVSEYDRATAFLRSQRQESTTPDPIVDLSRPIYLDRLALSYFQSVNVLASIAARPLDIRIHHDLLEEMEVLIDAEQSGDELLGKIDRIVTAIRSAVQAGKASFLSFDDDADNIEVANHTQFSSTAALLKAGGSCDVICIDDKSVNKHSTVSYDDGKIVGLGCVLDILRLLSSQGAISSSEHWVARHRLRRGGYSVVPPNTEELVYWLQSSKPHEGQLVASVELNTISHSFARIDSVGLLGSTLEAGEFEGLSIVAFRTIYGIWENTGIDVIRARSYCDWIWQNCCMQFLASSAIEGGSVADITTARNSILVSRIARTIFPMNIASGDRTAAYKDWLSTTVFGPFSPANSQIIDQAVRVTWRAIKSLEGDRFIYARMFLDALPRSLHKIAIGEDIEFSAAAGVATIGVLVFRGGVKIHDRALFAASRQAFERRSLQADIDSDGVAHSLKVLDDRSGIVVLISGARGKSFKVQIPALMLLSPEREERLIAFRQLSQLVGATSPEIRGLAQSIGSTVVSDDVLSRVNREMAHGVAETHRRLRDKVRTNEVTTTKDLVPSDICYFDRFCGPDPNDSSLEEYFGVVLATYRRNLVKYDTSSALDVCCFGCLRNDLLPGRWFDDVDDDALWSFLLSGKYENSPFSLLAALDIALYRQSDPRFFAFAGRAVLKLSDRQFGSKGEFDIYSILNAGFEFAFGQICHLEGSSERPGFWRRMCAWMQTELIIGTICNLDVEIDWELLQESWRKASAPGVTYRVLADQRLEPMYSSHRPTSESLYQGVIDRLVELQRRHEREGRLVPRSECIDLARRTVAGEAGRGAVGLFEGHKSPTAPIPREVAEMLCDEDNIPRPRVWAAVSHSFRLERFGLERVFRAIRVISRRPPTADLDTVLDSLRYFAVVAAVCRNQQLAEAIADAVSEIVSSSVQPQQIPSVVAVTLHAGAAIEDHDRWVRWIDDKLTRIARELPAEPEGTIAEFMSQLELIGMMLPTSSWFHLRARCIALAGR